ncbi:hypothetical protein HAX54_053072 [Datura stramonium]|uniref:Uncharacterized protein n=1 Tax=Datura stramonium TaxID=4076 RepID=A0ABS8WP85_DATST|nr:hypothetical protein [Datura stramonium]
MDPVCDLCGVVRAEVYCKSDSARLCLQCDGFVHSANPLSRRHSRSLICDKCTSQPAVVRCMDEAMCLCEGCDWNENGCIASEHRLQKLNPYTGCPSPDELTTMLSLPLEMPISNDTNFGSFGTPCSSLSINENNSSLESKGNEGSLVASKLNELASNYKFEPWALPPDPNYMTSYNRDPAPFSEGSGLSKVICCSFFSRIYFVVCLSCSDIIGNVVGLDQQDCPIKDLRLQEGYDLSKGVDFDDVTLNFDCGYEILGGSQQIHPRYSNEDKELDCIVMEKNSSVTGSNNVETSHEATSSVQQEYMGLQSSQMAAAASSTNLLQSMSATTNGMLMNPTCNGSIGALPFLPAPIHPSMSLSLSNITGESSATTDYQDCGLSPGFLNEAPWDLSLENCPQKRQEAKMRYNEKKKTRTFGKQIRYASRKARADTRRRVKGRFVKAGEAYDYDPSETRDF